MAMTATLVECSHCGTYLYLAATAVPCPACSGDVHKHWYCRWCLDPHKGHRPNDPRCWCRPDVLTPCLECDGVPYDPANQAVRVEDGQIVPVEPGPRCWRCRGKGCFIVEWDDLTFDQYYRLVHHRSPPWLHPALRTEPGDLHGRQSTKT